MTIADLPDTPLYAIKVVCAQTGIRPVTLRAWERRYGLLRPHRTRGNYRLYSERDVALLRWLKQRVDAGLSISSAAAELAELRRSARWPDALPAVEPLRPGTGRPTEELSAALFAALSAHDEPLAASLLAESHQAYDLATVSIEVVIPCLVEIGRAWEIGKLRIATEHFASGFLRGRLITLFQAIPVPRSAQHIVVGCGPQEMHDIGPLILALLLRQMGFRAEFLGPDLHLEDLGGYAQAVKPALIILSAGSAPVARALDQFDKRLARLRPRPKFAFGGRAFNVDPNLRAAVPGTFLGETLTEASLTVRRLVVH